MLKFWQEPEVVPEVAQEGPQQGWLREQARLFREGARRTHDPGMYYYRADALDDLADNIPTGLTCDAWMALWNWESWSAQYERDTSGSKMAGKPARLVLEVV